MIRIPGKPRRVRINWRLPIGVARRYYQLLSSYLSDLEESIVPFLREQLPTVIAERNAERVRLDAWTDTVDRVLESMKIRVDGRRTLNVSLMTADVGQWTSKWNDDEWQRILKSVMGVTLPFREPWLYNRLDRFSKDNAALISTLEYGVVTNVETLVRTAVSQGRRHEEVVRDLRNQFGVARKRARLIARDQVSKLNSDLSQSRQRDVGIEEYYWETSDDERVRGTRGEVKKNKHNVLDGKLCRWNDSLVYSPDDGKTWLKRSTINAFIGHPGEDYQCRCWARPKFTT